MYNSYPPTKLHFISTFLLHFWSENVCSVTYCLLPYIIHCGNCYLEPWLYSTVLHVLRRDPSGTFLVAPLGLFPIASPVITFSATVLSLLYTLLLRHSLLFFTTSNPDSTLSISLTSSFLMWSNLVIPTILNPQYAYFIAWILDLILSP